MPFRETVVKKKGENCKCHREPSLLFNNFNVTWKVLQGEIMQFELEILKAARCKTDGIIENHDTFLRPHFWD